LSFRLEVIPSDKFVKAQLVHFENGTVVQASTQEWCIKKHLYKTADFAAYINLARVFAMRCLMSGIIEMSMKPNLTGQKIEKFVEILKENGLSLEESPEIYVHKDRLQNRFIGKKMKPRDWKEIHEFH
jgi:large subunit ribosomal protein L18